jgi:hypothetical protein
MRKINKVVGAERVVLEMMLDDPNVIEIKFFGKDRLPYLLVVDLLIADALQAEASHDLNNSELHG